MWYQRVAHTTAINDTPSNENLFSLLGGANQAFVLQIPYVHTFDLVPKHSDSTSTSPKTDSDNTSPSPKTNFEKSDNTSHI